MSKKTPTHVVEYEQFEIRPPAPVPFWLGIAARLSQYFIWPALVLTLDGSSPGSAIFICMLVGAILHYWFPAIARFAFLGAVCTIPCALLAHVGIAPFGQVFIYVAIMWYHRELQDRVDVYETFKKV